MSLVDVCETVRALCKRHTRIVEQVGGISLDALADVSQAAASARALLDRSDPVSAVGLLNAS
jgi:hypothetical protein